MVDVRKKAELEPERVDVESLLDGTASSRKPRYEAIAIVAESNPEKVREVVPELVDVLEEFSQRSWVAIGGSLYERLYLMDALAHVAEEYPEAVEPHTDELGAFIETTIQMSNKLIAPDLSRSTWKRMLKPLVNIGTDSATEVLNRFTNHSDEEIRYPAKEARDKLKEQTSGHKPTQQTPREHRFTLPTITGDTDEGEIIRWHVAAGDEVKEDQPIAELQMNSALVEIRSPVGGIVSESHTGESEVVSVGEVLITIEQRNTAETSTAEPVGETNSEGTNPNEGNRPRETPVEYKVVESSEGQEVTENIGRSTENSSTTTIEREDLEHDVDESSCPNCGGDLGDYPDLFVYCPSCGQELQDSTGDTDGQ